MWDIVDGLNAWYKEHYKDSGFFIISSVTETNRVARIYKIIKATIYYVRYKENGKPSNEPILDMQRSYREDDIEGRNKAERELRADIVKMILNNIEKLGSYARRNDLEHMSNSN